MADLEVQVVDEKVKPVQKYPSEPLPPREEMVKAVSNIVDEVGPQNLTMKVLRARLQAEFKVDLSDHKAFVTELVEEKIREPQTAMLLAKINKEKEEGLVAAGKGKAKRAKDSNGAGKAKRAPREKKETKEKPAKRTKHEKSEEGRADGPPQPKGAQNAYMHFVAEKRPEVMKEEPGLGISAFGKKLGDMWKNMTDEEKKPYADMAVKDKERYADEMEKFKEAGGVAHRKSKRTKGGREAKEKSTGPKRPCTAFFMYINDKRKEFMKDNPSMKITDVAKRLGEQWKLLPAEERKIYDERHDEDVKRYEQECKEQGVPTRAPKSKPEGGTRKRVRSEAKAEHGGYVSSSSSGSSSTSGSSGSSGGTGSTGSSSGSSSSDSSSSESEQE